VKRPRFVLRLVSDCVRVTLGRDEVEFRREVVLLRIDCVSVSCFSRSRPLCVGRGVTSDEELSTRVAIAEGLLV
jgi:hypothetical protein